MKPLKIKDLVDYLESWVPVGSALSGDNSGWQLGDPNRQLKNILLTLDITDEVIEEAIKNKANLILSHHPLIYNPLRKVDFNSWLGRQIAVLIKHDIAVYSAHTNLDASRYGVSVALAKMLGVEKPEFLKTPDSKWLKKIAVFVPAANLEEVRRAMAEAGAGVIGDYTYCSFNVVGEGTFLAGESASPAIGGKGVLERHKEVRLEMILPNWAMRRVVSAMQTAHPYEEVAYDVYNLDNFDVNYGFGAVGDVSKPVPLEDFFVRVKKRLGVKALSVMGGPKEEVKRIAVCGGSGGPLVEEAYRQGADVFVTGELKYHTYLEYKDRLSVVVAGHYATERVVLPIWAEKLRQQLKDTEISVLESKISTNPVEHII